MGAGNDGRGGPATIPQIFESAFLHNLCNAMAKFPGAKLSEALSRQQIVSKKWALEMTHATLGESLGLVFVMGGWYGVLPAMMFESGNFRDLRMRSFDVDPSCAPIADTLNRPWVIDGWRFKAATADMYDLDYQLSHYQTIRADGSVCELRETPALIINLACEHLPDFGRWLERLPRQIPLVLQSNNFFSAPDHCNCVNSLEEFKAQAGLSNILFQGALPLEDYTRFMLIGSK